jgi:hypothetical protein
MELVPTSLFSRITFAWMFPSTLCAERNCSSFAVAAGGWETFCRYAVPSHLLSVSWRAAFTPKMDGSSSVAPPNACRLSCDASMPRSLSVQPVRESECWRMRKTLLFVPTE